MTAPLNLVLDWDREGGGTWWVEGVEGGNSRSSDECPELAVGRITSIMVMIQHHGDDIAAFFSSYWERFGTALVIYTNINI